MDLSPIFEPVTDQSQLFEKKVVNNKRFVTNITKGSAESRYGIKDVFVLNTGSELPKEVVLKILDASKKTLEKFNDKFDWSKRSAAASGYGGTQQAQETDEKVLSLDGDTAPVEENVQPDTQQTEEKPKQVFSFDDVNFDT